MLQHVRHLSVVPPISPSSERLQLHQSKHKTAGRRLNQRKTHGHIHLVVSSVAVSRQTVEHRLQEFLIAENHRRLIELRVGTHIFMQPFPGEPCLGIVGRRGNKGDFLTVVHIVVADVFGIQFRPEMANIVHHEPTGLRIRRRQVSILHVGPVVIPIEHGFLLLL